MRHEINARLGLVTGMSLMALFAVVGCDDDDDDTTDASVINRDGGTTDGATIRDGSSTTDGSNADALTLSDQEIVGVVSTANAGEIQQGNVAVQKGQSPAVRAYGQMMVTMHTMAQQRSTAVAQAAGIFAASSATQTMLQAESNAIVAQLQQAQGSAFDSIYIDSQIAVHQRVLDLLDRSLIPQAKNAMLRADLQVMRGDVAAHLAEAQQLRADANADGGVQDASVGG